MLKYLDGKRIYYSFAAGTDEVSKYRSRLNKINVFPIPDGDTGNNLYATFSTITDKTKPTNNINAMMSSIADVSLEAARGNSGIIMAQFLNGWAESNVKREFLTTAEFGESVLYGVNSAYQAITNPVEGTILTVIRKWAEAVNQLGRETEDFVEVLSKSLVKAKEALSETPAQLEVLRKSKVVDAGAQGFVYFLEGVVRFARTEAVSGRANNGQTPGPHEPLADSASEPETASDFMENILPDIVDPTYRYCTQVLIQKDTQELDDRSIRQQLSGMGESLIVGGNRKKIKLHIHCNAPDAVLSKLQKVGTIAEQKVDDMRRQYQIAHQRKYDIALFTDSIADLPPEFMDEHQINMLPLNLIVEGTAYLDKLTVTPGIFYNWLDELKEYPSTSLPSVKVIQQRLEELARYYPSIIVITVAKPLSGTWNAFRLAAAEIAKNGPKITVIDSRLNSGAQGLLVMAAARAIAAGKEHGEVVRIIEDTIPKTKIYVSVDTFKYMVRNGRVSPVKGLIGKLLNIKPIVSLDEEGKGVAFGKSLSRKSNLKNIVNIVSKAHRDREVQQYSIVHASALPTARVYEEKLTNILGFSPEYTEDISPIVGLNAGKGAIAVSYITKE